MSECVLVCDVAGHGRDDADFAWVRAKVKVKVRVRVRAKVRFPNRAGV